MYYLPNKPKTTAWVIFSGQTDLLWLKILKEGYRHCYVLLNDGKHWITIDPLSNYLDVTVHDLAAEKMVPMVKQIAQDFSADHEVEKLINHFGGADQWKEVSRQLLAFGQRNLPSDVLENLSSSYEGVLALYKMMQSEEPSMKKQTANPSATGTEDLQYKNPAFVKKVTEGFQNMYGE